jgi:erythronate-4-phosphate dehydrogenase
LINASRGAVHDEAALARCRGRLGALALDVWEHEPAVAAETVRIADIGTPHVAGYSSDGRVRATELVYKAACVFFHKRTSWKKPARSAAMETIDVRSSKDPVSAGVMSAHPLLSDHRRLRRILRMKPELTAAYFARLRATYPLRREFHHYRVLCTRRQLPACGRILAGLGFETRTATQFLF